MSTKTMASAQSAPSRRTEITAGIATFMTMAYILFVNPSIIANPAIAKTFGVDPVLVSIATCLVAAISCILMGAWAKYPFALASGMGLNAYLAFSVILGKQVPFDTAMGLVVIEGLLIVVLVVTRLREYIFHAIPINLKRAIAAGIGLFIAFIGFKNGGLVVPDKATFVALGNFGSPGVWITVFGLIFTGILMQRKVTGALLWGILASTALAIILQAGMHLPTAGFEKGTLVFLPQSAADLIRAPRWPGMLSLSGVLDALRLSYIPIMFALLMSDFFDMMGTIIGLSEQAGFIQEKSDELPRLNRVLLVDGIAAVLGGLFRASSATTYIESAAGIAEGGRTGLTSIVTGICFLLAVLFAPIAGLVPAQATAPALILVGFLMMKTVLKIDFSDFAEGASAFLILILVPLTSSIANGIGFGFVVYSLLMLFSGRAKKVSPLMWLVSAAFAITFFLNNWQYPGF